MSVVEKVKALAQEAAERSAQQKQEREEAAKRNRERYPDIAALLDRLHAGGFPNAKVTRLKGAAGDTKQ